MTREERLVVKIVTARRVLACMSSPFPDYNPEDLKQAMKSKPLIRRAIREWARSIFVGITENGDPIPQQSQWTGTFTELGMSLHPSFRDTSVKDIYRALKDLIEEEFLELGAREGMDNVLTIKPGPKFIKAFGHLLDEPLPVRTSLFHHLKSNLDAFFEDVPGRKWIGCLNRVGYTFTYPSDAYTDGEVEDALTRLHLEGFYTVEQHGPEYHISRALSHKDKLKKAILDWHRAHFGFLKEAKDCRDTFEGFRSALGYYGAPAQYTEADFQAALYDISQDRTFDSEYLRSDTDKPWTYKVFPGPLKTPGSDEASEESLETAMLDYFKAWFTDVPKMKDWTGTIGELRERCFWVAKEGSAALVRNTKTYRIRKTLEELCFRGWLSSGADKVNKESELVYCVTPGVKMNPETTTAQIKTAILAWHKWFWDDEHCAPYANADFKRWAEILKHYGAPAGDFIGGAGYSASQFEVALRQLAEEENIPSKRCSERVTAPSEYYIFPRGTSYETVRNTGPFSTLDAVIWCYTDRSETRTTYDSLKNWIGAMLDTNASTAFVWGGHAEMIRIAAKSFFPRSVEVDRVPASEIQDALVRLHGEGFCDVEAYGPAGSPTIPWWIIQRNGRPPKKPLRVECMSRDEKLTEILERVTYIENRMYGPREVK